MKHPNIVEVYDYTETEDEFQLYMEYVNRSSYFEDRIQNVIIIRKNLNPISNQTKLKSYAYDMISGLEYIHSFNIIHCDMKLSNMILNKDPLDKAKKPILKIIDFGLCHVCNTETNKAFMPFKCGSFDYMAPEIGSVLLLE